LTSSGAEEDLLPSSAERGAVVRDTEALEGESRSSVGLGLDLRCCGLMGRQRGLTARGSELQSSRVCVSTFSRRTHTSSHFPHDVRPEDPRLRSRSHVSLRRTLLEPPPGAVDTHTRTHTLTTVRSYQGTLTSGNQNFIEQNPSEVHSRSDHQEIRRILWNPNFITCSQEPATGPCPETDESSPNSFHTHSFWHEITCGGKVNYFPFLCIL
jgi:hypothetical protein